MKTITGKYYQCEHCGRKMFGAGALSRHEKYCKDNPNNAHICFDFCKHLEKSSEPYHSYVSGGEIYGGGRRTVFTCKVTGKKMYSYHREKQYWQYVTPDMIRMPLDCKDFQVMSYDEMTEDTGL